MWELLNICKEGENVGWMRGGHKGLSLHSIPLSCKSCWSSSTRRNPWGHATWGQTPKSVLKTIYYSDIIRSYRLNGRNWEFNAEYSRSYLASLKKGMIVSREARKCAGEDKAHLRFMRRKWDLTVRSDEWAWYFRRGNRPYQKGEYRWAKNDALVTRQGKCHITSFSHISSLITHHSSLISLSLYNSCSFDLPIT